jgi:hypothetical protein
VIFGGNWSVGQVELEPAEEQRELGLWLGIAGQLQFTTAGGGDVDVDHLDGGEFLEQAARGQAGASPFRRWPMMTCRQ